MLAADSEAWHRKGGGNLHGGFVAYFRHGGEVFRPGPASVVRVPWTWAADAGERTAYARFYALYRNPKMAASAKNQWKA